MNNYYLVRTIEELVKKELAGIGWSQVDLSQFDDINIAVREISRIYNVGRRANQIKRYVKIRKGDYIVIPLPYRIAIARAEGTKYHDPVYAKKDRANIIKLEIPRNDEKEFIYIPRTSFSEAFQRRIKVKGMTINNLREFEDEILEAYESIVNGKKYSWINRINSKKEKLETEFRQKLLSNIQAGNTNLKTGGLGLESLIKELLELDGYKARILPKNKFESFADADIQASRGDKCTTNDILIQVKHHQGYSDSHGINQLEELMKLYKDDYEGFSLIFITSASVSKSVSEKADELNIKVLEGEDLVDWITEHIDNLSESTKSSLGIFEVPSVF